MYLIEKYANLFIVVFIDILIFTGALYIAHLVRFDLEITADKWRLFTNALPVVLFVKLILFYLFDLYRGMWRYTSIADLINIIKAATSSTLVIVFALLLSNRFEGFSRSVFVIDWLLTILMVAGFRVGVRFYFEGIREEKSPGTAFINAFNWIRNQSKDQKKLLIIGAGDCGEKMYREIRDNGRLQYQVVGFLDDNPVKIGKKIHGIPVLGSVDRIKAVAERVAADEALISMPSAHGRQMRRIVECCKQSGIPFKTVPSMRELIDGRLSINAIREVAYRDLLGREVIRLDENRIGAYLRDQCVLVTGAGGSIGSELCRQILRFCPKMLVLFDRGENALYEIEMELRKNFPQIRIIPLLADVQDVAQVNFAFRKYKPQTVFHAAAYKHVPMLESQPWNPVKNNIFGTMNVVEAARNFNVEQFVFVSTDKAVRPTNFMGASKRVAEIIVQNQNACFPGATPRFVCVRFGNVVGSAGSVIPLFKKQIREGGPITVTHSEMTRYFMMIPEACQLILQAGGMGKGGEIFLLDMGEPVRIVDMATDLIRLSGLVPDADIKIEYTGLRPGEKLYEELITAGEGIQPTDHEKIMVLKGAACDLDEMRAKLEILTAAAEKQDTEAIRKIFRELVPEFHSPEEVVN